MSRGINRAKNAQHAIYESVNSSKYCVFISHKYEDLEAAREIAAYIQDSEIDVYLDDNDNGLQKAAENNDSEKIVRCIETGLQKIQESHGGCHMKLVMLKMEVRI